MPLVSGTGWPHRAEDVLPMLELGEPLSAVDRKTGTLAGIAVFWPMGEAHGRVGLVIVSPQYQRQGLGRALMERILDDARGRPLALLATEEGRPLYEKLGFQTVEKIQRHVGHYTGQSSLQDSIEAYKPSDLDAVLSIDRKGFGPDREAMIRRILETGTARVVRDGKDLVGYAVTRPFGLGHVVGPIVTANQQHALDLFKAVAQPGYIRLDRPLHAEGMGTLIEQEGLKGQEVTHAMTLGDWPAVGNAFKIHALSGHAWG